MDLEFHVRANKPYFMPLKSKVLLFDFTNPERGEKRRDVNDI